MLRYFLLLIAGLLLGTFLGHMTADAATSDKSYTFNYSDKSELKITVTAENRCAAYKKAAKLCYNILTGGSAAKPGVYPGEEQGLDIIDTCANPTNYNP